MTPPTTYFFYDLETSGLNPAFDQILQFAAIRTDADFMELERHEFRIRLRPDIIPSPGALLTTNVSILKALNSSLSEYEAVRQIHALINQPGTISIGYNSLTFDDLFLRFAFCRNLLPVYPHQWQNGCRRLDLFPITVLYWLPDSPLLTWPTRDGDNVVCQETYQTQLCAWVSNGTPSRFSTVTVYGRLLVGGSSQAGQVMETIWHYLTTTSYCDGLTGSEGVAHCSRSIGGATDGFQVNIEVEIEGQTVTTWFVPE